MLRRRNKNLFLNSELKLESPTWSSHGSGKMNLDIFFSSPAEDKSPIWHCLRKIPCTGDTESLSGLEKGTNAKEMKTLKIIGIG